jgi:hypothetical protein
MRVTITQKFENWVKHCDECGKIVTQSSYYYNQPLIENLPYGSDYVSQMLTCDYNLAKGLTITGVRLHKKDSKTFLLPFTISCAANIFPEDWHKYITIKMESSEGKKLDKSDDIALIIKNDFKWSMESITAAEYHTEAK